MQLYKAIDRIRNVPKTLQTSKMKSFTTIVNGFQPLIIVTNLSIVDVCGGPGYASGSIKSFLTEVYHTETSLLICSDRIFQIEFYTFFLILNERYRNFTLYLTQNQQYPSLLANIEEFK